MVNEDDGQLYKATINKKGTSGAKVNIKNDKPVEKKEKKKKEKKKKEKPEKTDNTDKNGNKKFSIKNFFIKFDDEDDAAVNIEADNNQKLIDKFYGDKKSLDDADVEADNSKKKKPKKYVQSSKSSKKKKSRKVSRYRYKRNPNAPDITKLTTEDPDAKYIQAPNNGVNNIEL